MIYGKYITWLACYGQYKIRYIFLCQLMHFHTGFWLVYSRVADWVISTSFVRGEICWYDLICIDAETVDFTTSWNHFVMCLRIWYSFVLCWWTVSMRYRQYSFVMYYIRNITIFWFHYIYKIKYVNV